MKKRNGFVTNSSSSCFICQITGREESGMGMSRYDAEMEQCVNGHLFDNDYLISVEEPSEQDMLNVLIENSKEQLKKYLKWSTEQPDNKQYKAWVEDERKHIEELENADSIDDFEDEYDDLISDSGVPDYQCPICQFMYGVPEDLFAYMLKEYRIDKQDLLSGIKDRFGTYRKFLDYVES